MPATNNLNLDLDQSGTSFQKVRTWLGPSLGWIEVFVKPTVTVTVAGPVTVAPGTSIVLVNTAGLVTINLPDVTKWLAEFAYQPATAFERVILVKDLGGNAGSFNITVDGFGSQTIDGSLTATISVNHALLKLYPLNSGVGWFIG